MNTLALYLWRTRNILQSDNGRPILFTSQFCFDLYVFIPFQSRLVLLFSRSFSLFKVEHKNQRRWRLCSETWNSLNTKIQWIASHTSRGSYALGALSTDTPKFSELCDSSQGALLASAWRVFYFISRKPDNHLVVLIKDTWALFLLLVPNDKISRVAPAPRKSNFTWRQHVCGGSADRKELACSLKLNDNEWDRRITWFGSKSCLLPAEEGHPVRTIPLFERFRFLRSMIFSCRVSTFTLQTLKDEKIVLHHYLPFPSISWGIREEDKNEHVARLQDHYTRNLCAWWKQITNKLINTPCLCFQHRRQLRLVCQQRGH